MQHQTIRTALLGLAFAALAMHPSLVLGGGADVGRVLRLQIDGDDVIAFGAGNRRLWTWTASNPVTDVTVGWQGNTYVTTLDGHIVALGPGGQKVWSHFLNGSGEYVQIERYGTDGFVAKIDASWYRDRHRDPTWPDTIQIFRRHEFAGQVAFPAHARLQVRGARLYAVFRRHGQTRTLRVD